MYRHQSRVLSSALVLLSCVLGFSVFAPKAEAAKVTKVKGAQALIDLEGDSSYAEGNRYIVMVDGKRRAIVEIAKVKGDKAIAKILKGTAAEGGTLAPLSSAGNKSASRASHARSGGHSGGPFKGLSWGLQGTYGIAGQNVTQPGATSAVSMTGNTMGLQAFGDYPLSEAFGAIARAGFENFSVTGSDAAGSHKTSILYLTGDFLLRYNLIDGAFRAYPLAGLSVLIPLSSTVDIISKPGITSIILLGAGADYAINNTMYVKVAAEYGYFPVQSSQVTTSLIELRAGVGFAF